MNFGQLQRLSDEVVMTHLKAGHGDALAVLFDRYHRLVLNIAARILRDPGEAEDLMQAVFFEIFRVAAQFDPAKGTTRGWLLQYTYHRCLNRRQYLRLRGLYGPNGSEQTRDPSKPIFTNGNGNLHSPELARLVEEGLSALTSAQRKTIKLAFFEGLSMAEIAQGMNESVGNVRHHYYRGLKAMRSRIFGNTPAAKGIADFQPGVPNVEA